MKTVAVVYLSHDGLASLYTGVGTSGRDFCLAFETIQKKYKKKGLALTLFPGTIRYKSSFHGYRVDIENEVSAICKRSGGKMIWIDNGTHGTVSYGGLAQWKKCSASAAKYIRTLSEKYDHVIAFANDTPFAGVGRLVQSPNVSTVWVPHSTVMVHKDFRLTKKDGKTQAFTQKRFMWERAAIQWANESRNNWTGYTSLFMKRHLVSAYRADLLKLMDTQVGIYFPRLASYRTSQTEIKNRLTSLGIPTNKELITTFARAEMYKGVDLTLALGKYTHDKYGTTTVILVIPYSNRDPYIKEMQQLRDRVDKTAILLFGHDFLTPHLLMQWKHTKMVAVLSRQEPAGHVPNEFRYYSNPNARLLVSDRDGLPERVADGADGFITSVNSLGDIKRKADTIFALSSVKSKLIAKRGRQRVLHDYSIVSNIDRTLKKIMSLYNLT